MTDTTTRATEPVGPPPTSKIGSSISHIITDLGKNGIFIALIVVVVLFTILTDGILLRPQNISNLIVQNGYILILAIGMVLVIVAGHIDLSVGSVAAFVGAVSGVFAVNMDMPWWLAIILSLLVGALVGAWQGFWIAYVGIPAFIVTLAGMLIFRGLALVVLGNANIGSFPSEYRALGNGYLTNLFGEFEVDPFTLGIGALAAIALVVQQFRTRTGRQKYGQDVEPFSWFIIKLVLIVVAIGAFTYALATFKGIPITLIVLAVLVMVYGVISKRTVFGRHVFAIGGNEHAATLTGVPVRPIKVVVYMLSALSAGIAGIIQTGWLGAVTTNLGTGMELQVIAAAVIGGASLVGGIGTATGALVGAALIEVIRNSLGLLGINAFWQGTFIGGCIIIAVAFERVRQMRSSD